MSHKKYSDPRSVWMAAAGNEKEKELPKDTNKLFDVVLVVELQPGGE